MPLEPSDIDDVIAGIKETIQHKFRIGEFGAEARDTFGRAAASGGNVAVDQGFDIRALVGKRYPSRNEGQMSMTAAIEGID